MVGECEIYKEERDGLEDGEMREIDERGMQEFGRLEQCRKKGRYPRR